MTISQYREAIKRLMEKVGEIKTRCTAENREPTEAETALKTKIMDEVESLQERLAVEEREERIRTWQEAPANPPLSRPAPQAAPANDDRKKDRFASRSEFLAATIRAGMPGGLVDDRLRNYRAASGMGESVPSDGGSTWN